MSTHLQKLIDILFDCDRRGVAGNLVISTQLNIVSLYLEDGFLVNSSLKGPGQTFLDFLLSTGRITKQGLEQSMNVAKEEAIAPWVALLRTGLMTEDILTQARYQLAAQRLAMFIGTDFSDVGFERLEHSGTPGHSGAQRAVLLVLEYLRIAHASGRIESFKVPPYAVVRPTDRLKTYIESLRSIIPGRLPLPMVGGETYESLRAKFGPATDVLGILLLTGMLKTEIEEIASAGKTDVRIERLGRLIRNLVLLNARQLIDDAGGSTDLALETAHLLLEGFGAFEPALEYYKQIPDPVLEEHGASERKVLLNFLAGRPIEAKMDLLPSKLSSLPAGRDAKATLLRHLSIYNFFKGKTRESARCLHEAFIYKPYDFENLALFVQLLSRDPSIALDAEGKKGLEIESFREGEYPEVLPLAIGCAKANEQFELVSWIMGEGLKRGQMSSQVFDMVVEILRERRWGPDLVELVGHFSLSSDRKGWTNPLWTLGSLYSSENIDDTLPFAREAYEILIKTSSGKQWAFSKLVDIMDTIAQPNMLLDLLERSFKEAGDVQQRVAVGEKLAALLLEEFGEAREAGRVASLVVEADPQNTAAVTVILRTLTERKLGLTACRRFVIAMLRSSAAASGPRVGWMRVAARVASEMLGAPELAAAALARVLDDNRGAAGMEEIAAEKAAQEALLAEGRAALSRFDENGLEKAFREAMAAGPKEAERFVETVLRDPGHRQQGLGLVLELFEGGGRPWEAACRALALAERREDAVAFVVRAAGSLPDSVEEPAAVRFVEELACLLRDVDGGADDAVRALKDKLYRLLLGAQPYGRDVLAYYADIAAQEGDPEALFHIVEKRLGSSRAQEKGDLYYELATYADLEGQLRMRGPALWQISGSSMPGYPPVVFNGLQERIRTRDYLGAASCIAEAMPAMPRYLHPDLYYLASRLYLLAGDLSGYAATLDAMMERAGWHTDLIVGLAQEAMDGIVEDRYAVRIFGRMLKWHFLNPALLGFAGHVFRLADKDERLREELVSSFRACIDLPFPPEGSESRSLVAFFDDIGEALHRWGYHADAVRCIERSLLVAGGRKEKLQRLARLAATYQAIGAGGVEGLLLTLYRMRKEGEREVDLDAYLRGLVATLGIDLGDEGALTSLLLRSMQEEEFKWVDLVMAGFALWFTGDTEKAADLACRSFETYPDIVEAGFFAAYCYETLERWQEASDLYQKLALRSTSGKEASKLLKRASLIADIKLARERESLALLIQALERTPEDENLFREIESRSMKLEDKAAFIQGHEIVETHLPGRQTQRAFYYRYAKNMEDVFGDMERAARILLKALALSPRRGPVMDSIVRVAMRMQKFKPISQAASVLRAAGATREELAAFILDGAKQFMGQENLPSAYGLMADAIKGDPALDLVEGVKMLPTLGPAGTGMARRLMDEWIGALEAVIGSKAEDPIYYKRLDSLSDMRDILIETSEAEGEKMASLSIPPPSIDEEWEQIAGHPDEEITLEMFPNVDISARRALQSGEYPLPPPEEVQLPKEVEEDLPSVIIDLPPEEMAAIAKAREIEAAAREAVTQPPRPSESARAAAAASREPSADFSSPSIPTSLASKIIESIGTTEPVDVVVVPAAAGTEPTPDRPTLKVAIDAVRKSVKEEKERRATGKKVKATEKPRPAEPVEPPPQDKVIIDIPKEARAEAAAPAAVPAAPVEKGREVSSSVEVAIVSRTEDAGAPAPLADGEEPETVWDRALAEAQGKVPAGPVEPSKSMEPARATEAAELPKAAGAARPMTAAEAADLAKTVKIKKIKIPKVEPAKVEPAKVEPSAVEPARVEPPAPPVEQKPPLEGDKALAAYAEAPWELDRVKDLLGMKPEAFSFKASSFLLRGMIGLHDLRGSKFTTKDYRLIGRSGTSRSFSSIVAGEKLEPWCEALELLWENAPSLAVERLSDYGVNTGDQITPFSSGPVAPVIERAIRAFGYVRASVFSKRERKMQIDVVRTNPPSVIVLLPLGKIPPALDFQISRNLWAASGRRILSATLPVDEGDKLLEAAVEAFGRHSRRDKIDPIVSSIVQDMWQIIPPRIQERLRGMIQGAPQATFTEIRRVVRAECIRAGFLFSGDLPGAVREFLPSDMLSSLEGDIPRDLLTGIVKDSPEICAFVRFAFSRPVLSFMDEFLP